MATTNLFVNVNAPSIQQALVRSLTDNTPVPFPELVLGDNRQYNLYFTNGDGSTYAPWSGSASYVPYIGIGPFGQATGGTFTLTYGGQTTAALAWNISPAALQTAFQALSSVGAGNCLVTGVAGQYYIFTFAGSLANQPITQMTGNSANLTPIANLDISTPTPGTVTPPVSCVQMIYAQQNPWTFADNWTPISNGWTGFIAGNTVPLMEAFAASTSTTNGIPSLIGTLQISAQDPSSNFLSYLETPATVLDSLLNLHTFASAQAPTFVTSAQLAAAVLGLNNFTRQDLTATAPGTTNVAPASTSRNHTADINFAGATAGTYNVVVQTTNGPNYGDQVLMRLYGLAGLTAGTVINIYSGTTSGTLIQTITLDGSQRPQVFVLVGYNTTGTAWFLGFSTSSLLDATQNLLGLSSTLTSKLNLRALFANVQSKSAAYTVVASDEGSLFKSSAAAGAFAYTLPTAATAGSGFLVAFLKTDSTASAVSTSPATAALTTNGQLVVLESDGTNWNILINVSPPQSSGSLVPELCLPNITGLTGGGSTKLDGIATAGGATTLGQIVSVTYTLAGGPITVRYRLRSGTDASAAMFVIRPQDFNATTNQVVWELLSVHKAQLPCVWNTTQAAWQQLYATGAIGASALALGTSFTFT